jgi:hypothetical protein
VRAHDPEDRRHRADQVISFLLLVDGATTKGEEKRERGDDGRRRRQDVRVFFSPFSGAATAAANDAGAASSIGRVAPRADAVCKKERAAPKQKTKKTPKALGSGENSNGCFPLGNGEERGETFQEAVSRVRFSSLVARRA